MQDGGDIAFQIDNFINEYKGPFVTNIPRKTDPTIPYGDSVRASKWQMKEA